MKMHTHKKEIGPKWILKVQENGERGIWDEKEGKWETLTLLEEMEIMHEGMWVVVAEWDQRERERRTFLAREILPLKRSLCEPIFANFVTIIVCLCFCLFFYFYF